MCWSSFTTLVLSFVLLASPAFCALLPFKLNTSSLVTEISDDLFVRDVFGGDHVWVIAFYRANDTTCKEFAATWEEVAAQTKGLVRVGAIDAAPENNVSWVADALKITQVPVVISFPSRLLQKTEKFPPPVPYRGSHNTSSLVKWSLKQLPNELVYRFYSSSDLEKFQNDTKGYPVAMMFHNFSETPHLLSHLTLEYSDRMLLAEFRVRSNNSQQVAAKHKVTKLPTLLVFPQTKDKEEITYEKYTGNLELAPVKQFLEPHLLSLEIRDDLRERRKKKNEEEEAKKKEKEAKEKAKRDAEKKAKEDEAKRKRREKKRILKERDDQYQRLERVWEAQDGEYVQVRDEGWDEVEVQ